MSSVTSAILGEPAIAQATTSIHVAPEGNTIEVGATNTAAVSAFLQAHFGSNAHIAVEFQEPDTSAASRYAGNGPVVAGSALVGENENVCTAGYGSRAAAGQARGQTQYKYFVLTAGHCFPLNMAVGHETGKFEGGIAIGTVRRNAYIGLILPTDGEGIFLMNENLRSHSVLNGDPLEAQPIQGVQVPHNRETVCWSGIYGGNQCGKISWHGESLISGRVEATFMVKGLSIKGDSGGPVWDPETHKAVGLMTAVSSEDGGKCWKTSYNSVACTRMKFTPLLASGGSHGIIPELGVEVLGQD